MLAHLDLLTILVLIAGDLEKCFGFCLAGFLKLQPAEGLGHSDYLPGALVVVALVGVEVPCRDRETTQEEEETSHDEPDW